MKKALPGLAAILILFSVSAPAVRPAPAGFQKVSPHFFYFESASEAGNTGAVVTTEGVLLIDPPPEAGNAAMLSALKALTSRPVRWIIFTDYQRAAAGGWAPFLKQGAAVILGKELDRLAGAASGQDANRTPAAQPNPRFTFGQQVHLWPSAIEIRVLAVKSKARTAGDVVVFLPAEKVLATGELFVPSSFPVIDDGSGEGSARGWIDGFRQVIDFVPLLKSAMPQPKPDPAAIPEPAKTLEETFVIVPGHGPASNMQEMKKVLAAAQKLRVETSRAHGVGRSREVFIKSLPQDVYGEFGNLEDFAGRLFDELGRK